VNLWATAFLCLPGSFCPQGQNVALSSRHGALCGCTLWSFYSSQWIMLAFPGFVFFRRYSGVSSCSALHALTNDPRAVNPMLLRQVPTIFLAL